MLDGRCSLGILGALSVAFPLLASERLGEIPQAMVAAQGHPLAGFGSHIPRHELAKHVQLVRRETLEREYERIP